MADPKPHVRKTPNPETFVQCIKKCDLLTQQQLSDAISVVQSRCQSTKFPSQQLMDYCVEQKLLTSWQCRKLATGSHRGFTLGNFVLQDVLGAGGMSAVFLATHKLTQQKRAIKILPKKKLNEKSYLARFYREGRAVAAMKHPNIVRIYDIAEQDNTHYMVMEYLRGTDLHQWVEQKGPADFAMIRDSVLQAAAGIAHAHKNQMIHRDVKPANLLIDEHGTLKVLDLGLALLKKKHSDFALSKMHNERVMGTADYLSPEQAINSHEVDHRTDIYSLGCTMYYLLTGQAPFPEGTLAQRLANHQTQSPTPITDLRPDCPRDLETICGKMMRKQPDDRFQSCDQLIVAIQNETTFSLPKPKTASFPQVFTRQRSSSQSRKTTKLYFWVGILLVLVAGLAYLAIFQLNPILSEQRETQPAEPAKKNATDSLRLPGSKLNTGTNSTNVKPYFVDFEDTSRFKGKVWSLVSNSEEFGSLRNGKFEIASSPNSSADTGQYSLLLSAHKNPTEFRPYDKSHEIAQVAFLACGQSSNVQLIFEVRRDKAGQKWTPINAATQLSDRKFAKFEFGGQQFDGIQANKFRFRIEGQSGEGVYIDNLVIELK